MTIICGDCLEEMRKMEDNSINAIVTDPPYGLSFMGKGWDYAVPNSDYWKECWRISKPGSFLIAMGGTRTFHRLTCAIENAGFEIRDCISWLYGSGFPKSHNNFGLEGYGTALKPAWEPCIVAMKPLDGTFKQNAERWGQAGINMEYLIQLIMPPKDGILLDPFAGSGTTILAAYKLGLKAIGIEKQPEYAEIAKERLSYFEEKQCKCM